MRDIHIDSLRYYTTYTDPIGNMLILLNHGNDNLKFYLHNNDLIENFKNKTSRYEIKDLNKNSYFNACSKFYKSDKNMQEIHDGVIHKDRSQHPNFKSVKAEEKYANDIAGKNDYYIVDGIKNKFIKEKNNKVIIDRNFCKIYKQNFLNRNVFTYEESNKIFNNKLILKNRIELDDKLLKKYDNTYATFIIPTYNCDDESEFDFYKIVFDVLHTHIITNNDNPIKKLILISGSNRYKKHFTENYDWIVTTHFYEERQQIQRCPAKMAFGTSSKTKGKIDGYLKDMLYVQEFKGPHLDYSAFIKKYKDIIERKNIKNIKMWEHQKRVSWYQGIDCVCRELKKHKNLLNPST